MAALTGVVATMDVRHANVQDKFKQIAGTLVFGDGTSTYPSGGIPITKAQLGFRNTVRNIDVIDNSNGDGYVYKINLAGLTVRIYQVGASNSAPLSEVTAGTFAPAANTTLSIEAEGY